MAGDVTDPIRVPVVADTGAYARGMRQAAADTRDFAIGASKVIAGIGTAYLTLTNRAMAVRNEIAKMAAETGKTREQVSGLRMAAQATGQDFAKLAEATDLSSDALSAYNDFTERFGSDVGPKAAEAAELWRKDMSKLQTVVDGCADSLAVFAGETRILHTFAVGLVGIFAGMAEALDEMRKGFAFAATGAMFLNSAMRADIDGMRIAQAMGQQLRDELRGRTGIGQAAQNAAFDFLTMSDAIDKSTVSSGSLIKPTNELTGALKDQRQVKVDLAALDAADAAKRQAELDERKDAELRANAEIYEENRQTDIKAAEERRQREQQDRAERESAAEQMVVDAIGRAETSASAVIETEAWKQDAQAETMRQVGEQAIAVGQAATDLVSGVLDDQVRMWANMGEMGRKEAMKLWIVQKALAMAMSATNTAVAVTAALASPAALAAPGASLALAVTTGILGGVQIAAIAAQQPSFHAGSRASDLAPDERTARITRSETVLTQQGMQAMAASANAGALGGGGAMTIQVGHDLFDAVLRDVDRPGARWAAATGRSRVGHRLRRAR